MTLTGSSSTTKSGATSAADAALTDLLKSATFAMSLGAKELFHTNFLAFILESQDPALAGLQDELRELLNCPWVNGDEHFCLVWREKKHLDLIIVPLSKPSKPTANAAGVLDPDYVAVGCRAVVVEAKLKSIPTPGQLKQYNNILSKPVTLELPEEFFPPHPGVKKITITVPAVLATQAQSSCRILLSPRDSVPLASVLGWKYVAWDGVVKAFATALVTATVPPPTLATILTDYQDSLSKLLQILTWVDDEFGAFSAPASSQYIFSDLVDFMKQPPLVARRIHDLAGKYCFSLLESKVRDTLFPSAPGKHSTQLVCGAAANNNWALNTYTSYSRMSPCVGFEWKHEIKNKKEKVLGSVSIGVQVQGTSYRHFVSVSHDLAQLESLCSGTPTNGNDIWSQYLNPKNEPQGCSGCTRQALGNFRGTNSKGAKLTDLGIFQPAPVAPKRLTNLKVFNVKQFLYSDFDCGGLDFNELQAAINCSLCIAGVLICSGQLDNLVTAFSLEHGNNGAALGRGDEETERQDNSEAS